MPWGLFPYCLCHGRVHRILVAVTTCAKSGWDKGVLITFGQGNSALLLLMDRRYAGYMSKCAASWTCVWSDLISPFFFRRSLEKLYGVHLLNSIVFCQIKMDFYKMLQISWFQHEGNNFLHILPRSLPDWLQSGAPWFFDANHCQQHHLGRKNNKKNSPL